MGERVQIIWEDGPCTDQTFSRVPCVGECIEASVIRGDGLSARTRLGKVDSVLHYGEHYVFTARIFVHAYDEPMKTTG